MGASLWRKGDQQGAIDHYLGALQLEGVAGGKPWLLGRSDLATLHRQLAGERAAEGDREGAWEAFVGALGWRLQIFARVPASPRARRELAEAYRDLGDLARGGGPAAAAGVAYHLAVHLLRPLAEAGDPAAAAALLELAGRLRGPDTPRPAIAAGSSWRYFSSAEGAAAGWADPSFDDAGWAEGAAQLGYGDDDERTRIGFGGDPANKWITAYFRRHFDVPAPGGSTDAGGAGWIVRLLCDDGAAVYLNGEEVGRLNLPPGPLSPGTAAAAPLSGGDEDRFHVILVPPGRVRPGANTLAVEVHQAGPDSSDLSFDLELAPDPRPPGGLQIPAPEELAAAARRLGIPLPKTPEGSP